MKPGQKTGESPGENYEGDRRLGVERAEHDAAEHTGDITLYTPAY